MAIPPNIDDPHNRKPDTTKPYLDRYEDTPVNNILFDVTTYRGQRNIAFSFLLVCIILITMAYQKVSHLEKEIQFKETDYQILLHICNEKG